MIDFVDTSLFLRITFWVAIEKQCTMHFHIAQTGLFCRIYRFCIRESLIFKLEICVHLFINRIDNILALLYTIFVSLYGQLFAI